MQTFPNSTERSSDFNSTSNLVLTKTIPRHCFIFSKNWQTSGFSMNFNKCKTCPSRDLQTLDGDWPKIPFSGQSAWSGDGMTQHQGTWVREVVTNSSRVLDPHWPIGGERDIANTGMTGNRSWPVPLSGPPGLFISGSIYQIFFPAVSIYFGQQVTGYFHQQTQWRYETKFKIRR